MTKKIGVLLSGCGVYDGTEIHEATLTLLFLDRQGAQAVCLAPDDDQHHVINHATSQEIPEKRNILTESARIARGQITSLDHVKADDLDGLILPGGFGAAKNWSNYAIRGRECTVRDDVKNLIIAMNQSGKPVGAICIAPVILARALQGTVAHPLLTIGNDAATAADVEFFGARHQDRAVNEIAVDDSLKIVSTPAYMLGPGIADVARGIEKLVKQVLVWA